MASIEHSQLGFRLCAGLLRCTEPRSHDPKRFGPWPDFARESTGIDSIIKVSHSSFAGERGLEPHPSYPCTDGVPIMKGLMSPAVLVHRHHLTTEQVAHLYEALYMFSFAFHGLVHIIVQQAAHSNALKEAVWHAFAELWQAALGLQFPTEILRVLQERDAAIAAVAQKGTQAEIGHNDEIEERCVAACM